MLKIENISKTYPNADKKAVDDISFRIKPGEIFGFLGPNGAGKTTTIEMIVGIQSIDEGNIYIDGLDIVENSMDVKYISSYVPDNANIYGKLKAIEYLNFIGDIYEIDESIGRKRINKYAKIFKISEDLNLLLENYSRGMKQKLLLTSALMTDPKILILDEPMVGLDPKSSYELKNIMKDRCKEGKSIFFSTHVLEIAEEICHRVAIINKGKIIKVDTIENIRSEMESEKTLEELFLELTEDE